MKKDELLVKVDLSPKITDCWGRIHTQPGIRVSFIQCPSRIDQARGILGHLFNCKICPKRTDVVLCSSANQVVRRCASIGPGMPCRRWRDGLFVATIIDDKVAYLRREDKNLS